MLACTLRTSTAQSLSLACSGLERIRTPPAQDTRLAASVCRLSLVAAEGLVGDGVISREELELGLQMAAKGSAPGMNGSCTPTSPRHMTRSIGAGSPGA